MARGFNLALGGALAALFVAGGNARAEGRVIKSHEHEAERAGIKLAIYEKWAVGEEQKWRNNGKVVLLIHGATWSSKCTWDVMTNYSLMDTLAEAGYDVFALDLHGYGKSGKSDKDWTEATTAVPDVDAAIDYVRAFRWVERVHIIGYQWGAQVAGLYAVNKPNKVGKLVLFGMRWGQIERTTEPTSPFRLNGASNAMLKPDDGDLEPEFVRKRSQVCLAADPQSPNGVLRDLTKQSPVEPGKVRSTTLLIQGDRDGDEAALGDRLGFYKRLGTHNKWFVMVPGLGKYANVERGRAKFEAALFAFLDIP